MARHNAVKNTALFIFGTSVSKKLKYRKRNMRPVRFKNGYTRVFDNRKFNDCKVIKKLFTNMKK